MCHSGRFTKPGAEPRMSCKEFEEALRSAAVLPLKSFTIKISGSGSSDRLPTFSGSAISLSADPVYNQRLIQTPSSSLAAP